MKNFLILFPVLTILTWASYTLWEDFDKKAPEESNQEKTTVGYIAGAANTVKRKTESDPLWYNLSDREYVFNKDIIKTGVDSSTTIILNDKTTISLDENSLVALEKTNSSFQIDLKLGDFSTKNTSDDLILKVKDTVIKGNQADLFISTDLNNNTQVQVQKGNAVITDKNNQQIQIDRNKLLEINANGKVKSLQTVVLLSSPENNVRLKDPRLQVTYPFTWAVLVDDVKQEILEISSKEDFNDLVTKKVAGHQGAEGSIQQGLNFWRVSWNRFDPDSKKIKLFHSTTRKIYLEGDDRIRLQNPKDQTEFQFLPGEQNLIFDWDTKESADHFLVEISSTPNFKSLAKTETSKAKSISIKDLNSGGYYWRVRAFDQSNTLQGLSQTRAFSIKNILPSFPELISPSSQVVWSLNEPLQLEWKPYSKANTYTLTIAKDLSFKNIAYTQKTNETKLSWPWSIEGKYYWQVTAYNND
ncbi:MAG: FecR domain-containing protein, partial [Bdellovibrionales bacterium]|nr:FecR domain-containing protein [Bdellovibrionales bacterium]